MTAFSRVHQCTVAALFVLLLSFYMLTYSGRSISSDELRVMDGITSFYHFGDWLLDETAYLSVPDPIDEASRYPLHPLPSDERSAAWLALPLYALAHAVPALGMMHMVWLLNVFTMALAGCVVFGMARALGYARTTALIAALAFGLGTLVWPYSKTLFRDPLLLLWLSLAALGVLNARAQAGKLRWGWVGLAIAAFALAALTKVAAWFALPALVWWVAPRRLPRWLVVGLIALPVVAILALMLITPLYEALLALAMQLFGQPGDRMAYAPDALFTYLFSPTASLWATSPVLLLALPGAWLVWRKGDWHLLLAVVWLVGAFALGHALTTAHHWFGGFSFPPRFMLPVIPFVLLLALPVFDVALRKFSLVSVLVVAILGFSGWVQLIHAVSFLHEYSVLLPAEAYGTLEWQPALQDIAYSRWLLLPQSWGPLGFDVAWWRAPLGVWPVATAVVGLGAAAALVWLTRGRARSGWLLSGLSACSVVVIGSLATTLNRHDGVTFSTSAAAARAAAILRDYAQTGDLLLTPFSNMTTFLLNHNRSAVVRPITLPIPSLGALPEGISAADVDPLLSVHPRLTQFIGHLAARQDRAWLLTNSTPFQPQAPRADEHYLSTRFYLIREHPLDDIDVRLLEYILEPNPPYAEFHPPSIPLKVIFDDQIALEGVTLPRGTAYHAGAALPVLLYWQALQPLPRDYTIALFVVDAAGRVVAQGGDGAAVGGWMPTRRWPVGHTLPDRRGIMLPSGLAAGEYELWVVLYHFVDGQVERLSVTSGEAHDGTVARLPLKLSIR